MFLLSSEEKLIQPKVAGPIACCVQLRSVPKSWFSARGNALNMHQKNTGCTPRSSVRPKNFAWQSRFLCNPHNHFFTLLARLILLRKNFYMLILHIIVFRIQHDIWEQQLNKFHKCKCLSQTMSQSFESCDFVFSLVDWQCASESIKLNGKV